MTTQAKVGGASALLDRPAAVVAEALAPPMHVGAENPAWRLLAALERVSWAGRTTAAARLREYAGWVRESLDRRRLLSRRR